MLSEHRNGKHTACNCDNREEHSKHVGGVLSGPRYDEHDASGELGGDRIGISDGARCGPGAGGVHGDGPARAYGMRGDGVGVRDIGEVPEQPRGRRDEARDCDDGRAIGEHVGGVLGGSGLDERDAS